MTRPIQGTRVVTEAPMNETLKPCPFCGGRAALVKRDNPMSKWKWSVDCTSSTCGMSGPVEASGSEATTAWNTRTPSARAVPELLADAKAMCRAVVEGYPNPNINHEDYRVTVCRWAEDWLEKADAAPDRTPAGEGGAVAWRVKDFADGWILCGSAEHARLEAEGAGNLIQPLFTRPQASLTAESLRAAIEASSNDLYWSFEKNDPYKLDKAVSDILARLSPSDSQEKKP